MFGFSCGRWFGFGLGFFWWWFWVLLLCGFGSLLVWFFLQFGGAGHTVVGIFGLNTFFNYYFVVLRGGRGHAPISSITIEKTVEQLPGCFSLSSGCVEIALSCKGGWGWCWSPVYADILGGRCCIAWLLIPSQDSCGAGIKTYLCQETLKGGSVLEALGD